MIIKSLGRKASEKLVGGAAGRQPFTKLVQYMTRSDEKEKSQSVLWHGFYGHPGMSSAEIIAIFESNARLLKGRKNGNILYHEILSFSAGYKLEGEALVRAVADIGQEYLWMRAPKQMAFGAVHFDTEHIHLHLLISANEVGKPERVRLTRAQFAQIQKVIEGFTLARYPELAQTRVYDREERERVPERIKTQAHEQAMKSRTRGPSRRERLKAELHGMFEQAGSAKELYERLRDKKMELYTRGKSIGVIVRDADGTPRRFRLATLGVLAHFEKTQERFGVRPSLKKEERQASVLEALAREFLTGQLQPELHPGKQRAAPEPKQPWTLKRETAGLFREFLTGKLQPEWHARMPGAKKRSAQEQWFGQDNPRGRAEILFTEFLTGRLQPEWHDKAPVARDRYAKPLQEPASDRKAAEIAFWEFLTGELQGEWHGQARPVDEVKFGPEGQWGQAPRARWKIYLSEFLTGKLQSEWHGQEHRPKERRYTDEILRAARERDAKRREAPEKEPGREPGKDRSNNRGDDRSDDRER